MRSAILLAAGSLVIGAPLAAQEPIENYSSIASYVVSIPTGDTRQLLTRPSWVGVAWEGLWAMGQSTAAGVLLSLSAASAPMRNPGPSRVRQLREQVA